MFAESLVLVKSKQRDSARVVFDQRTANDRTCAIFNELDQIENLISLDIGFSIFLNAHELHPPFRWREPHALRLAL